MANERRCGIYYLLPFTDAHHHAWNPYERQYISLLHLSAEIKLYPTYSKTTYTQLFVNPSKELNIPEATYTFPLLPSQSINAFTAQVGDKTIKGVVKSKPSAKKAYDDAVAKGETAALLDWNASDVWTTKVGNIPGGETVSIVISTIQELSHDSERDAIKYVLPTHIAPRYGAPTPDMWQAPTSSFQNCRHRTGYWEVWRLGKWTEVEGGIKIKVSVAMDSPVQMVESPLHPAQLSMGNDGTNTNEFNPTKACLELSNESAALDTDFVVLVKTARTSQPSAVLQRHPTKNSAAIAMTLVPKFNLPTARPEVIFIVDRSGSMSGTTMEVTKKALQVFLRSLPVGVKYNICSFGSHHSFLWPKSKMYDESSLAEAQTHVAGMQANYGGTEMFAPMKAIFEKRYEDLDLEVLLLTDGEIQDPQPLFDLITAEKEKKRKDKNVHDIRIFTLGIGSGVSYELIQGTASLGDGFAQTVQGSEKLDAKVVRMLRAAIQTRVENYSIDLKTPEGEKDEYDMMEDVPSPATITEEPPKKKISLFDEDANMDTPMQADTSDEARWAHLPPFPKLPAKIQSPNVIPPLYPFSRTNVYIVLSPVPNPLPEILYLHGTTATGDEVELEIPVMVAGDGEEVHQLAARSFISELERGVGYMNDGVIKNLQRKKIPGQWDEVIEREGVRWGTEYGVAGKWTSFVAVQDNETPVPLADVAPEEKSKGGFRNRVASPASAQTYDFHSPPMNIIGSVLSARGGTGLFAQPTGFAQPAGAMSFPHSSPNLPFAPSRRMQSAIPQLPSLRPPPSYGAAAPVRYTPAGAAPGGAVELDRMAMHSMEMSPASAMPLDEEEDDDMGCAISFESLNEAGPPPPQSRFLMLRSASKAKEKKTSNASAPVPPPSAVVLALDPTNRLHALINLQTFSGFYKLTEELVSIVLASFGSKKDVKGVLAALNALVMDSSVVATVLAILAFEESDLKSERETSEMVVEKALDALSGEDIAGIKSQIRQLIA